MRQPQRRMRPLALPLAMVGVRGEAHLLGFGVESQGALPLLHVLVALSAACVRSGCGGLRLYRGESNNS